MSMKPSSTKRAVLLLGWLVATAQLPSNAVVAWTTTSSKHRPGLARISRHHLPASKLHTTMPPALKLYPDKHRTSDFESKIKSLVALSTSSIAALLISFFAGPMIDASPISSSPAQHLHLIQAPAYAAAPVVSGTSIDMKTGPRKQAAESTPASTTVLDEVWGKIDKYYIDRTFNGQDWNKVRAAYQLLLQKQTSNDDTAIMALTRKMVNSLGDRYSRILDKNEYAAIQKFDLIGVGVTLMPSEVDKQIIVGSPPVAGSASDRAGLRVGDRITKINSISTSGRTAFDIIDQIAENPNAATVAMTVQRDGEPERTITMERTFQEVKNPIQYKISETRPDGTKVGLVRISEFNSLVKPKLEQALQSLEDEGANAYVLDIRSNTGGAFQSAVEISGLFLDDKVATTVVDSTKASLPFRTTKGKMAVDATDPLVVWIDGRSASASEVLAGSLHDNCRAILMGEKSFGKGMIQAVYGLKNGAGLVLTVARYMTPSGSDIQGIGISPDIAGHVSIPIPGFSTDTSMVNFEDVKERLAMCHSMDS